MSDFEAEFDDTTESSPSPVKTKKKTKSSTKKKPAEDKKKKPVKKEPSRPAAAPAAVSNDDDFANFDVSPEPAQSSLDLGIFAAAAQAQAQQRPNQSNRETDRPASRQKQQQQAPQQEDALFDLLGGSSSTASRVTNDDDDDEDTNQRAVDAENAALANLSALTVNQYGAKAAAKAKPKTAKPTLNQLSSGSSFGYSAPQVHQQPQPVFQTDPFATMGMGMGMGFQPGYGAGQTTQAYSGMNAFPQTHQPNTGFDFGFGAMGASSKQNKAASKDAFSSLNVWN
jgi:hypothetical protein